MENIKKTLKERASGLLLIVFAVFIVTGVSVSSHQAESKNEQSVAGESQAVIVESQETSIENEASEEVGGTSENGAENVEKSSPTNEESSPLSEADKDKEKEKSDSDAKKDEFKNVESRLEKYCHKSGSNNKKGCKQYCSETKKASKKDDSYDGLYEKYCKIETTIVVKNKGGKTIAKYNNYRYSSDEDITVLDFMKMAAKDEGFSFKYDNDPTYGAFIYEINGTSTKDEYGYYWKLDINGKMSNTGASGCEVSDGDKIEWEYTKW
jgi:hypothetical protein